MIELGASHLPRRLEVDQHLAACIFVIGDPRLFTMFAMMDEGGSNKRSD